MDSKFKYKGALYDKIGSLSINGRNYLFVANADNVEYIRIDNVEGKPVYVAPSKKFSLEENAGKSLVQLNERILMNHITEKLKTSNKKTEELIKEIQRIQELINQNQIGASVKKPLTAINESAHKENITRYLNEFDSLAYPTQEEKKEFEFPSRDELGETKILTPIDNIDSYLTNHGERKHEDLFVNQNVSQSMVKENTPVQQASYVQMQQPMQQQSQPAVQQQVANDVKTNNNLYNMYSTYDQLNSILNSQQNNVQAQPGVQQPQFENFKQSEQSNPVTTNTNNLSEINMPEDTYQVNPYGDIPSNEPEELTEDEGALTSNIENVKVKTIGTHPSSKKAAFADIVIFCLVVQLVLFVGLIFVMLLIK